MEMDRIVNVAIIRNPYNWVIVVLMLLIFLASLEILTPAFQSYGTDVNRVL